MNKSIFTLLTIALLFCFVINTQTVFAIPQPFIRKFSIESLQGIRPSEYVSANAASLAKGKMLLRSKGRGEISIKRWQQSGQSYSNDLEVYKRQQRLYKRFYITMYREKTLLFTEVIGKSCGKEIFSKTIL